MNANELMIGDWVCTKVQVDDTGTEPVFGKIPQKVVELTEGVNGIYVNGVSTFDGAEIEPIPLTSEILENNGFHEIHKEKFEETRTHMYVLVGYDEGFVVCGSDEYGYYLGVDIDSYPVFVGSYRVSDNRYTKGTLYPKNNLMYVHQLQNILKLFGVEKEIEL